MDWNQQNNTPLGGLQQGNSVHNNDPILTLLSTSVNEITRISADNKKLQQQIDRQQKQITEYSSALDSSAKEISKLDSTIKAIKRTTETLTSDIKNTRDKTLEPLAVFVGLFTFVSVGFNIFANVKDTSLWISLLLIIAGIVIIFSSLIIHTGSLATKENGRRFWTGLLILIGLIIVTLGTAIHLVSDSVDSSEIQSIPTTRSMSSEVNSQKTIEHDR